MQASKDGKGKKAQQSKQPSHIQGRELSIFSLPLRHMCKLQVAKDGKGKKARQGKRLTGRCWMADKFPMSLRQLIPVLDIIGRANKYLARVGKFLQKYGDMDLFPVKLQVCQRSWS